MAPKTPEMAATNEPPLKALMSDVHESLGALLNKKTHSTLLGFAARTCISWTTLMTSSVNLSLSRNYGCAVRNVHSDSKIAYTTRIVEIPDGNYVAMNHRKAVPNGVPRKLWTSPQGLPVS